MNDAIPVQWQAVVCSGVLVMVRLSSLLVFAPIFSSAAIAPRIKAGFVFAMTLLLAPLVGSGRGAVSEITVSGVLGELAVGLLFGLSLMMLGEMVVFAGALLGMDFSFSLVNLLDPNSKVETPVLGQFLGWVNTLVLLGAGLHRTLLAALMRTFNVVPVGTFVLSAKTGATIAYMAGGIFLAGVQLASPVIAAALTVEITVGLIGRLAPQLHSNVMSVPFKTIASYVVLLGSLALWPGFLESRFNSLLDAAGRMLRP
jgi:flagellar biosynthetic protein FliR